MTVVKFQIHYAVQHESEKPLGLFHWPFRPETAEITIRYTRATSITFKYMVDKLEQS